MILLNKHHHTSNIFWYSLLLSLITNESTLAFLARTATTNQVQLAHKTALKSTSDDEALSKFKKWCISQEIITPLDLQQRDTNYRYMKYSDDQSIANRPEKLNGPILRVPLKSCILGETLEELTMNLSKERDMGEESYFAPYINVLPELGKGSSLEKMPRFWSDEKMGKISEFDGGQIYHKVELDKQSHKVTLDPWAHACVTSRANYLSDKGYAMTPILDMINHDSQSKTSATIVDDDLFLSVSNDYTKGEEVFISYGDLTNLETLCNYGFVSGDDNPCNDEYVIVRIIRKSPVNLRIDGDGGLDAGSLAVIRSYLTTPEETETLLSQNENLTINTLFAKKISEDNEEEMYSLIASFIDEAILDGKNGIEWAKENGDGMIERYLTARIGILEKGLENMIVRFPDLIY